MAKKPAESASEYLISEDKRIYDAWKRASESLKKEGFEHHALWRELARAAQNQYMDSEKHAAKFWGTSEIYEVHELKRVWEEDVGNVGSFFHNYN